MKKEELEANEATRLHVSRVRALLHNFIIALLERAETHDNSKFKSPEVEVFAEYTPKLRDSTYGSEEYKGFLKEMGVALEHHYAENSHHPEWKRAREERWLPLVGFEGFYEVSNFGEIRGVDRVIERSVKGSFNKAGKVLSPHVTPKGYLRVQLSADGAKKNVLIHRAVAESFIGPPGENEQVNHKNGDKQDNYVGNLEWSTPSENLQHAYDNKLRVSNAKYIVHCVEEDDTTIGTDKMAEVLNAKGHKVHAGGVWKCITAEGEATHAGLTFTADLIESYKPRSDFRFMDLVDLVEMFCDWKAASERHADGDIGRSVEINVERFGLDPQVASILNNSIPLVEDGELPK